MKRHLWVGLVVLCLPGALPAQPGSTGSVVVAPSIRLVADPVTAEDKSLDAAQEKLLGRPVLVSVTVNGKLAVQKELVIERSADSVSVWQDLPTGPCEVKFEGEGLETVVKKGLQILPGTPTDQPLRVIADLRAGNGVRVIEYGKAADPDDILVRLKKLEAAVAELKAAQSKR